MASTTRFLVQCWPGCEAPFDDSKTAHEMAAEFDRIPTSRCIVPHKVIEEVTMHNSPKKNTIIERDITDALREARRIQRLERILIGVTVGIVAGYLIVLKFLGQ